MPSLPRWIRMASAIVRRGSARLPLRPPLVMGLAGLLVLLTATGAMGFAQAIGAGHSAPRPTPVAAAGHLVQLTSAVAAAQTPSPTPQPRTSNGCLITPAETDAAQTLLAALNAHRAAAGARPLTLNPALTAGAAAHSCDMLRHHLISHLGSDGSTPAHRIQSTGLSYGTWGENIGMAQGLGLAGGVARIDAGMMAESLTPYDHHWNIVYPAFTRVGLGILYVNGQVWLTEDFVA